MIMETAVKRGPLSELLLVFLRLGLLGFGGPVALVGQMERELVAERGWLTKEQMREAIAICSHCLDRSPFKLEFIFRICAVVFGVPGSAAGPLSFRTLSSSPLWALSTSTLATS